MRFAFPGELVIDNFAGGGGASTGIEEALGRPVDIAINHSPEAVAMHRANHPQTRHFCEDIWEVDPRDACGSKRVGLAWFSPDCTHFSKAKGTTPVKKSIRGLAWVVLLWARTVKPRVIVLENVEEFQTWGPIVDGHPDPLRKGETFREWLYSLEQLGYTVEFQTLVAANYGTPTTRKRLFLIARRDCGALRWPEPTHGKGAPESWRPASEIIDWSLPCPSIFSRKRPLADATMKRIATGIRRYVVDSPNPFVCAAKGKHLMCPLVVSHYGQSVGRSMKEPLPTVTAGGGGHHSLVAPFMMKYYGGVVGHRVDSRPIGTITAWDHHALTTAFLTKFYGTSTGSSCKAPLPTITSGGEKGGGHLGLVMVRGQPYQIVDIGMRMLQPHELFAAQGFPEGYNITPEFNGKPLTKTAQISLAGNSVCPQVAKALVAANAR